MPEAERSRLRKIAIVLGAVVLGTLAIETTVRDLARQSGLPVGNPWFPEDARLVLRRAGLDEGVLLNKRELATAALGPARRARAIDPLDPLPLVIAGAVAQANGRGDEAITDFRAAKRVDPRLFLARYQLMQQLVERGSVGEGVDEIIASANLVNDYDSALLPALASASTDSDLRVRIFAGMRRFPDVRARMINYVSSSSDDDTLLQDLIRLGTDRATLDAAIASLVARGKATKAMALWRSTYRPDPRAFSGKVFDGRFKGLMAPTPIGWQKQADANLSVALGAPDNAPGQLQVTAFGALPATALLQYLTLPPGNYRLLARTAEANGQGADGAFVWSVACGTGKRLLTSLSFDASAGTRKTAAVDFTVPRGCGWQTLKLASAPLDISTSYSMAFDGIAVEAR